MNSIEIKISKNLIDYESSVNFMQKKVQEIQTIKKRIIMVFRTQSYLYSRH